MKTSAILFSILLGSSSMNASATNQEIEQIEAQLDSKTLQISVENIVQPSCNGKSDGIVKISVKGGEAPYSYNWNTFPNQFGETAIGLAQGLYFVYVTDANGVSAFKSIKISDPILSDLNNMEAENIEDQELTSTVSAAGSVLNFRLNGAVTDKVELSALPVGLHKLEISDNAECMLIQYIQVFELNVETEKKIKAESELINLNGEKILISDLLVETEDLKTQLAIKRK